ncbi:hypothetical protein C1645_834829 [Glomus cerebriforme]|uniref:Uncharacterized protein n=1 Tax=Glomus cerebriforme TaxID=658196 RepID=A0A397S8V1_9GLOM|nr:hypothetical protein C1645_834829 [Glomus cerebriforme]
MHAQIFKTAKKRANEKISLDNVNKKGCKKEELVASPSDDLNDLLNNEEAQQSKSKGAKRGYKKKQDMVAPPASKIIINLLNDNDIPDSRANNPINQINDIPSNRPILVLELRNEITPSNSTSKMISAIPDSRANSLFGHITSRTLSLRSTPLSPRDNTMNISRNIYNTSQYNFNMTDEDVPSPFNKMTIYQLFVDGLHFMPSTTPGTLIAPQDQGSKHFGDFRNKLVNSVIDLINNFKEKRNLVNPLQKEEIIAFVDESAAIHVLSQWLNATNMKELRAQNLLPYLCRFIWHAFAINYSSKDTEKMKTLDKITKNIAVPSRNGKNFASNLKL